MKGKVKVRMPIIVAMMEGTHTALTAGGRGGRSSTIAVAVAVAVRGPLYPSLRDELQDDLEEDDARGSSGESSSQEG